MNSFPSLFSLSGKRALVTGASRGLGAALAAGLAEAGADVAVHGNTRTASATAAPAADTLPPLYAADATGEIRRNVVPADGETRRMNKAPQRISRDRCRSRAEIHDDPGVVSAYLGSEGGPVA